MPDSSPQWTDAQWRGITTVGKSLLVSAAAGSGKTAMLAERCAHLVCDAPKPYRCDVDELLVVTFTDAAAAEMKARVAAALRARAAGSHSEHARRQLALIDQAHVSTLHSFCARLLREHFHLVGLDPAFTVMDGEEAKLLRIEVARELMEQRYELDDSGDFLRLVDAYAEGDDERLVREVIGAHELLASLVDPAKWLQRSRERLVEAAEMPLMASQLGGELIDLLGRRLAALRQQCDGALRLVGNLGGFSKYVVHLQELAGALRHWERVLGTEGPDVLASEVCETEFPRLPPVPESTPNKAVAKSAIDAVRDGVKSGPWRDCLRFTGDEWREGVRRILPHAQVFLNLVEQFRIRYTRSKDLSRQLDFADLERYALAVLRDPRRGDLHPTPTAREYHRLFKHVLVDEYQDINELQDAIIGLLSHERAEGRGQRAEGSRQRAAGSGQVAAGGERAQGNAHSALRTPHSALPPNLFCVGDVKQSIYRFRLADPERFLRRQQLLDAGAGTGEVIYLQSNFRSRAPLLEAINGVFERLMTREAAEIEYDRAQRLTPGKPFPETHGQPCFTGAPIELHVLPKTASAGEDEEDGEASEAGAGNDLDRTEREAVLLARRIRQLVGLDGSSPMCVMDKTPGGTVEPRPMQFRDVAVLLRSMRYKADQYADVLRRAGVPVHSESGTGYFESVEVRDVLALLSLLDNQRQDIPMASVLRSPLAALPEPEDGLARIRLAYPARDGSVPFHQAVLRYAAERDDALAARLRAYLDELNDWRTLAHRRPLAETVWSVYERTGYLAYVTGLPGGQQRAANLMYLHERAAQFDTFQRQGLGRFMQFLDNLRAESDLGLPSVASAADDVVRIMSVHRSKGLEFPVVILPDVGKAINLSDSHGAILLDREAGLGMSVVDVERRVRYPSLASTLVQERLRRQAMAEELRVLYVAMTRAKEHLILVGTAEETSPEKWTARWSDHRGPLPADAILNARTPLDWLGPVAACPAGSAGEIIRVTTYGSAEVAGWEPPGKAHHADNPLLARIAKLEPLSPPPPEDTDADAVIRRLSFVYPYASVAAQAAVRRDRR